MRNLFPPIIKQIDERGKRMAKQKDGRYRAKITVGTDASGKSIVKYVSGRTKKSWKRRKRRRVKSTSRTLPEPQEIYSIIHGTCLVFAKIKPRAQGAGRECQRAFGGQKYFFKKSMQNRLTTIPE